MMRDMDLVRDLLFKIEALPPGSHLYPLEGLPNAAEVYHHLALLIQAGYAKGKAVGIMGTNIGRLIRRRP
jgi:hypothetical protein